MAEIEKRKDAERGRNNDDDDMETSEDAANKIVFKSRSKSNSSRPSFNKSVALRNELEHNLVDEEKPILKGSKLLMPEYVIGQKSQTKLKRKSSTSTSNESDQRTESKNKPKPHLQHLFDLEEESD